MSRILKTMIVLLAIAAMAAPAFATDFSISGQMRVEGYYNDLDSNSDADMHWDQRLRVQSVWKVSDEVKVVLRTDIGESAWGSNGQYSVRHPASNSGQFQIDKAYLEINKEMFKLTAGEQYYGSPNAILVDNLGTGLVLTIKTPISIKLNYTKYDENGSYIDEDATDDQDAYSAVIGYAADNFSVDGILAMLDNQATDDTRYGYGVAGNFKAGDFAINAEFDILDGDNGAGTDYVGTQLFVDANTDISETLNLGGWFWYVAGTDDEDEEVIVDVTNWDSFNPLWGGYVGQCVLAADPITGWGPNDSIGNAGLIGAAFYATAKVNDDLSLKFQGAYTTDEDDTAYDFDLVSVTASGKYKVATNTYFMADAIYNDLSSDAMGDDDSISFWTQLQVNF